MSNETEVKVPDIGGATNVDVIEILVKPGDTVSPNTSLIVLESDKASMEIPSPMAGVVKSIRVSVGNKVSQGDPILTLEAAETSEKKETPAKEEKTVKEEAPKKEETPKEEAPKEEPRESHEVTSSHREEVMVLAGPGVRRMARELGVDLSSVRGTGREGRIVKEDVAAFVKNVMTNAPSSSQGSGFALPSMPSIDFSAFGPVSNKPLNKIKRLTGQNVHRAWVTVPHVTQFDEADVTDLEAFRKSESDKTSKEGYKLTLLGFVIKAVVKALKTYPQFNTSLNADGTELIFKDYFNIGIAVETPNGLVVPVIKGADKLSVGEIAKEMARLSQQAREKGLLPQDMSGGSFTISSLGGIGGTAFTPIVNAPEVAILGLSRTSLKPVYMNGDWQPRLMLPLSLSYDHRVIDGAEAARFTRLLSELLGDLRRILL